MVLHFSSGIVDRAKRERAWKSPHARGDFHARSHFARSAIPEEKWGTTRSLIIPSKSLHNQYLQFLRATVIPRRNWRQWLCKIVGGKQGVLWERWNSQCHHLLKTARGLFKTCSAWDLFVLASIVFKKRICSISFFMKLIYALNYVLVKTQSNT